MTETGVEPAAMAPPPNRRRLILIVGVAVAVLAAGTFLAVRLFGPLPAPRIVQTLPQTFVIPGAPPVLPLPGAGQAVLEVEGLGGLGYSGGHKPVPIASVAKVMTAYLVLRDHPMRVDEEGPSLTVSQQEADAYAGQLASGQSLVPVNAGESLSERQALVALLLPSANNVAHILARWDAGDEATFVRHMNETAARLGMKDTKYTDPAGLDPTTVSTAADQVVLAQSAMKVPALAQIVAMPEATLPVAGQVKNVNKLLGQGGIIGVKTGSTDQSGGCLLFAAETTVAGRHLRIFGAVLNPGPAMSDAFNATQNLIQAGTGLLHAYRVVHAGQSVANVLGPFGSGTTLAAAGDLDVIGWPGLAFRVDTLATVPLGITAAAGVGTIRLTASGAGVVSTGVQTTSALGAPGWWRRTFHG